MSLQLCDAVLELVGLVSNVQYVWCEANFNSCILFERQRVNFGQGVKMSSSFRHAKSFLQRVTSRDKTDLAVYET